MAVSISAVTSKSEVSIPTEVELQIDAFYQLSENLTPKEKNKEGEVYQLLKSLFKDGYMIYKNRFITPTISPGQSWPEILVEKEPVTEFEKTMDLKRSQNFKAISLVQYLKCIRIAQPSSLVVRIPNVPRPATPVPGSFAAFSRSAPSALQFY